MVRPMHLGVESHGFVQIALLVQCECSAKACGTLNGAGFGSEDGGSGIPLYIER
jgi:hypothetical protein